MTSASAGAIVLYGLVAGVCALAALAARLSRRPMPEIRHWLGCVGFLAGLAIIRVFDVEDAFRHTMRGFLREDGLYTHRWLIQVPLVILIGAGIVALMVSLRKSWQRLPSAPLERMIFFARLAIIGFAPLYALRLVSLHLTDQFLYSGGPFRLNWLLDLFLSLAVASTAIAYTVKIFRSAR